MGDSPSFKLDNLLVLVFGKTNVADYHKSEAFAADFVNIVHI